MKLYIFHVSAYDDSVVVKATWDAIIDNGKPAVQTHLVADDVEVLQENQSQGFDAQSSALEAEVVGLAGRFYPSETAFPLGQS